MNEWSDDAELVSPDVSDLRRQEMPIMARELHIVRDTASLLTATPSALL